MLCVFAALTLVVQDSVRSPAFGAADFRRADSIAAAEFAKDSLGSITVGVVSGSQLVWAASFGYADSARRVRATPATVYRIASVTKTATALMLLQLVERGQVNLNDPVERYFPEIARLKNKQVSPTLLQLATMTSGIARDPADDRRSRSGAVSRWQDVLVAAMPNTEFVRAPGTAYRYSNVGYAILGAALARAAKQDFVSYQIAHILQPLGMTSTSYTLTPSLSARLATGVDWDELYKDTLNFGDAARDHRDGLGLAVPSGGLYSTVGDVAKLMSLWLGFGPETVLRKETLRSWRGMPVAALTTLDYGYGLGYQAMRWGDTVAIGHSGNLAGYTSMILYDPERGFGVIVLRSAGGGEADAGRLAGRVFRALRAAIPPKVPTP